MPFILREENSTENPPLAVVYGKQITAGRIAYYIKEGGRTKCIIFLGTGEMDGVEKLYYNGELLPQSDASGAIWHFHAGTKTTQPTFVDVTAISGDTLTLSSNPYNTTTESEVALVAGIDPTPSPFPSGVSQNKKLYVVFSSGNQIKLSLTAGGTPLTWTSSQYLLDNLKVYRANAGFFDPLQGRPKFFPTIDYTFSEVAYVEVNLPSAMSEIEEEPTKFKIYVRGRRIQNYDENGLLADASGVTYPDQENPPAQTKFFSANNALVAADIILNSMKVEHDRIDWATFVKFRQYCDETIAWNSGPSEVFSNPTWTLTSNVTEPSVGMLTKTGTTGWNAGGITTQTVPDNFTSVKLQFTQGAESTVVGLTRNTTPTTIHSQAIYGIHPTNVGNRVYVVKNGISTLLGTNVTWQSGDVFRIDFTQTSIVWYKNDAVIHSIISPNYGSGNPLRGMVAFGEATGYLYDYKMFPIAGVARPTPRFDAHIVFPTEMSSVSALEQVMGRAPSCHWQDVNGKIKFVVGGQFVDVTLGEVASAGDRVLAKSLVYDPDFEGLSGTQRINVALSANGSVATASSYINNQVPSGVINGDRKPTNWGSSTGGWNDNTTNSYPDWLEIDFGTTRTIDQIDVITLPDNYSENPEPTLDATFTQYGIVDFQVQYWDGGTWQVISNVTGNNKVWRQFIFSPVTTQKIRVYVTNALAAHSRIIEVEAWQIATPDIPVRSNIVENSFSSYKKPSEQKQNFLRTEFRDIEDEFYTKKYTYTDRPLLRDYVKQLVDFGIVQIGVASQSLADRLSEAVLRWNTDLDLFVNVTGMADSFVVAKGDIIRFAHAVPGWTVDNAPAFIVTEETFEPDTAGERNFTLQIYSPDFYSDTDHGPITPSLASTSQSVLTPPPAPEALNLQENGRLLADGTYLPVITGSLEFSDNYPYKQRARIYWEKPGGAFEDAGIMLEQPNVLTAIMGFELVGAPSGVNRVKAVTETLSGIQSESEIINSITIGGSSSQIPVAPTNLRGELGEGFVIWKWDLPAINNFISHYEIRDDEGNVLRLEPGDSWAEPLFTGINLLSRTVYSVSNSGVYSTTGVSTTFSVHGTLPAPSNYTLLFNGNEVTHRWSSNPTKITWTDLVNISTTGENTLVGGGTNWGSGATSVERIKGNAYLECQADINHYVAFGFAEGANSTQSWTDISFGVAATDGKYEIIRNGVILVSLFDRQAGDRFRLIIENSIVRFYVIRGSNVNLMYTFADTPTFPLRVDISINETGHAIRGLQLFSANQNNLEYQIATDSAFTNVLWRGNSNFWSEIPSVMGVYQRYLRVVNTVTGAMSASVNQTLNLLTPTAPSSVTGTYDGVNIKWVWPPSTSLGVVGYDVYADSGLTSLIASVVGTQYIQSPVSGQSSYTIYVVARRINDNGSVTISATPRQGALTISNPAAPTGYTVTYDGDKLLHRWNVDANYKYVIMDGTNAVIWSGYGNNYDETGFSTASRGITRKLKAVNSINLESTVVTNAFTVTAPVAPSSINFDTASVTPFDVNVTIGVPAGLNRATIQKTIVEVLNNTDNSVLYTIVNDGVTETVNISGRFSTVSTRTIKARAMYADRFGNGSSLTTAGSHTFTALATEDIADDAIIASKIADGVVGTAHFASGIVPPQTYSGGTLPTLPNASYPIGTRLFWTINETNYINRDNATWEVDEGGASDFSELTGQVTAGQIGNGVITDTHINATSNFSREGHSNLQTAWTGGGDISWNTTTGLTWTQPFRSIPNALSISGHFHFSAKSNIALTATWTALIRRVRIGGTATEGEDTVINKYDAAAGYFLVAYDGYTYGDGLAPNGYKDYMIAHVNNDVVPKLILADGRILTNGQTLKANTLVPDASVVANQIAFSVGGGNLVSDSSFESSVANSANWAGLGTITLAVSTTQKYHGTKSLKLTSTTAGDNYVSIDFPVRPNIDYVFSAWLYVESITGVATNNRSLLAHPPVVDETSLTISHPTGIWVRKSLRIKPSGASLQLRLYCPQGTVYWDGIQLEEGEVATAYAPRPDEILPGTVGTTQIADNAITTPKLVAEAVTAGKIAANTITANEIAANAITASELAADSVIAEKIAAGAVSAAKIQAGAITAEKIAIGLQTGNLVLNPSFESASTAVGAPEGWFLENSSNAPNGNFATAMSVSSGVNGFNASDGNKVLRLKGTTTNSLWTKAMPVSPGERYLIRFKARRNGTAGSMLVSVIGGSTLQAGEIPTWEQTIHLHNGTPVSNTSWDEYGTPTLTPKYFTVPAGVHFMSIRFMNNTSDNASELYIDDVVVTKQVGTTYIQDGAITTDLVAANAIVATKIATDAISSDKIQANAITAGKIAVAAVGADQISANAIRADKIAIGTLTPNFIINPSFEAFNASNIPDAWKKIYGAGTVVSSTDFTVDGAYSAKVSNDCGIGSTVFAVNAGERYIITYKVRASNNSGQHDIIINELNTALPAGIKYLTGGSADSETATRTSYTFVTNTYEGADEIQNAVSNDTIDGNWFTQQAVYTPSSGIKYVSLAFYNYGGTGFLYIDSIIVQKEVSGVIISDGTVVGNKLVANSISGDKLTANSITATHLTVASLSGNLVMNSSFDSLDEDDFPHAWLTYNGTVGAQSVEIDGGHAVLLNSVSKGITSKVFPVTPNSKIALRYKAWSTGAATINKGGVFAQNMGSTAPINVALASNGSVATASTELQSQPASSTINGDRWSQAGAWGTPEGGWNDNNSGAFPDWLQVTFPTSKTINRIDVITIQDNYSAPSDPTLDMTFTQYGIVDFDVQYWNGSSWVTIQSVTGNNKVWRQFTFSPVNTTAIRILVNFALASHSRIIEVEAWGVTSTEGGGTDSQANFIGTGAEGATPYEAQSTLPVRTLTTTPTYYEELIEVPTGMSWMSAFFTLASGTVAYIDDLTVRQQAGDAFIENVKATKVIAETIGAGLVFADQIRQASYSPYQTGSTHSPDNAWDYSSGTGVTFSLANSTMTYIGSGLWDSTSMVASQTWQKIKAGTNGYIEATVLTKNANSLMFLGLSGNVNLGSYGDGSKYYAVDYGWHLSNDGNCYVYESSTNVFNAGTYAVGDIFKVSIEDGYVKFRKNGTLMYTSPRKPAVGTIRSIVNPDFRGIVGFGSSSGTQTITLQSVNLTQEGYGQGWRLNPLAGSSVYNVEPNWDTAFDTGTISSDLNIGSIIQKSSGGASSWDTSVVTEQTIALGDGWFQTTIVDATSSFMLGLSSNTAWGTPNYNTLNYGLHFEGNGTVDIWQSGSSVLADAVTYALGDIFRVAIEGNTVKYRKNGAVFYESAVAPTYPLRGKVCLYTPNALVAGLNFTASSSGAGEFNSGITVRGRRLEDIVRLSTQAIRPDSRYRGNDTTIPSNQVSSITYDTYHVSWEDDMWFANISVLVDDYKTSTTKNMDSLKSVRVRVYNKLGEMIKQVETSWVGRGVAFSGFIPRKYADMKQEAVFSFEFENLYGYSQPVWYSEAAWLDKTANTWIESPINNNISFLAPQWFSQFDIPTNCQVIPLTSESVRVTWTNAANDSSGNHQAYYRPFKANGYEGSEANEGWIAFGTAVTTGTKEITGLQSNTRYEFCVKSTSVDYGYSNIAYMRTFAVVPPPPTYNAPTALSGSNATAGQIDLTWEDNRGANYTKTEIFYVSGTGTPDATSSQLGTGHTDEAESHTGLGNSATYSYRARNNYNNGANYSDWSNTITVTTKPPAPPATIPTNVTISAIGYYGFTVNWTANGGATTHRVQVAAYSNTTFSGGLYHDATLADSSGKPRLITGLPSGNTFRIRVSADNGTTWSTVALASTLSGGGGGGDDEGTGCLLETNYITVVDAQETIREIMVKDLNVGDRVLGSHAGTRGLCPAYVVQLTPMKVSKLYTVRTKKGYEVQCSGTHRIIEGWDDTSGKPTVFMKNGNSVLVYDSINNEIVEDIIEEITVETGEFNIVKLALDSEDHTYIGQGILAHNAKPNP